MNSSNYGAEAGLKTAESSSSRISGILSFMGSTLALFAFLAFRFSPILLLVVLILLNVFRIRFVLRKRVLESKSGKSGYSFACWVSYIFVFLLIPTVFVFAVLVPSLDERSLSKGILLLFILMLFKALTDIRKKGLAGIEFYMFYIVAIGIIVIRHLFPGFVLPETFQWVGLGLLTLLSVLIAIPWKKKLSQ